jgi:hypothetical protein
MSFINPLERSRLEVNITTEASTSAAVLVEAAVTPVGDLAETTASALDAIETTVAAMETAIAAVEELAETTAEAVENIAVETSFDAIVDASGNGDHLTITAARLAGKKTIYVRNGNYAETSISLESGVRIEGESTDGVILTFASPAVFTSAAATIVDGGFQNFSMTQYSTTATYVTGPVMSAAFDEGAWLMLNGTPYRIASRTSDTVLELSNQWTGLTEAATLVGPNGIFIDGVRLSNFTLKHATSNAVVFDGLMNAKIDSVVFNDANDGDPEPDFRRAFEIHNCVNLEMRNCATFATLDFAATVQDCNALSIIGCRFISSEAAGIEMNNCLSTVIKDCIFEEINDVLTVTGYNLPYSSLNSTIIDSCKFHRCIGGLVSAFSDCRVKITGCDFAKCNGTCAANDDSHFVVVGNSFQSHLAIAIVIGSDARGTVSGNVFEDVSLAEHVVQISSYRGTAVVGNTFFDCGTDRFVELSDGSANVTVVGNVFADSVYSEDVRVSASASDYVVANNSRDDVTILEA